VIPAYSPFLALRYLLTRRINILGVFGVAFAVWAMLIVDGVFTGFVSGIYTHVHNSAPDLLLTDLPAGASYERLRAALADDDVVATAPRLRHHGMLQRVTVPPYERDRVRSSQIEFDHTENGFALLIGVDPLREPQVVDMQDWLERGPRELHRFGLPASPSKVFDEPDPARRQQLLLPDVVEWNARRHAGLPVEPDVDDHRSIWPGVLFGWRRIGPGNMPDLAEPYDLIVAAFPSDDDDGHAVLRTDSTRVAFAGWFGTGNRTFDETTAMVPIWTLRRLLGHDIDDPSAVDVVTDVAIRARDGLSAAGMRALQRRLRDAVQPLLPAGSPPCAVLDWQQQNAVFLSAVEQERALMKMVLFVVMLVSAFVIYATLHMMVTQKVKDIGILAAIGGSPRSIGTVFFLGGTVVAAIGTALGVGFGLLSAVALNPVNDWLREQFGIELFPSHLFDLQRIPCDIDPGWVLLVVVFAILLAVVVAVLPARKAARMNPVTALSFE